MPPAFNLSQDQTLQFDLEFFAPFEATHKNGIEVNFTSILMSVLKSCDFVPKNLATRLKRPRLSAVCF